MALYKRNVAMALLCLCFIVSAIVGSRAFIAGSLMALLFWLYYRLPQQRKLVLLMSGVILVAIVLLACMVKTDSSRGRLLVYKVSWRMFYEHWWCGVGMGNFDNQYLFYQATYFDSGAYTKQELLLADNTYYAFNDYWQCIVEAGVGGGIALLVVLLFLCMRIRRVLLCEMATWVQCIAASLMMVLLTASLFTHVVSSLAGITALLFGCAGLLYYNHKGYAISVITGVLVLAALLPLLIAWRDKVVHEDAMIEYKEADELSRYGYHKSALEMYGHLYASLKGEAAFLGGYAQAFERYGLYREALVLYQQLLVLHPSNVTCYKIGECYRYLRDSRAEYYYRLAVNMVPNRFVTREALFSYYYSAHRYQDAKDVGERLLHMPVKIPSDRVRQVLSSVEERMSLMNSSFFIHP